MSSPRAGLEVRPLKGSGARFLEPKVEDVEVNARFQLLYSKWSTARWGNGGEASVGFTCRGFSLP